jgi:predicted MFS family arabinose efflux permease
MPVFKIDAQSPFLETWTLKVISATICRLVLNTARRFPYTFAPVLSRGLGVPLTAITSIIAVNQATGVLGIFFGPFLDRFGYHRVMAIGILIMITGCFFASIYPFYWTVFLAISLAGLGKNLFDPAIQAYVGTYVPFEKRGRVVGVLEFSWAGSTLIGIPAIGLLIENMGWKSPFWFLALIGLIGFVALKASLPREKRLKNDTANWSLGWYRSWKKLIRVRSALGAMGFAFCISGANDNLFVVYGAWLEKSFDLSIAALGFGTGVIGFAELFGEIFTVAFADRLGLKRSLVIGGLLSTLSFIILPFLESSVVLALAGLFFVFFTFEFTIVTLLSLSTELLPSARGTMMASVLASAGIGRVLGALSGGVLWLHGGIFSVVFASVGAGAFGLVLLFWGLYGWNKR